MTEVFDQDSGTKEQDGAEPGESVIQRDRTKLLHSCMHEIIKARNIRNSMKGKEGVGIENIKQEE